MSRSCSGVYQFGGGAKLRLVISLLSSGGLVDEAPFHMDKSIEKIVKFVFILGSEA